VCVSVVCVFVCVCVCVCEYVCTYVRDGWREVVVTQYGTSACCYFSSFINIKNQIAAN